MLFLAAVTWAHHATLAGQRQQANIALILTVLLAVFLTASGCYMQTRSHSNQSIAAGTTQEQK